MNLQYDGTAPYRRGELPGRWSTDWAPVDAAEQGSMAGESGTWIWVCAPEDVVLMKMLWRKDSRSMKQLADAVNVVRGQRNQLDWPDIEPWARELGSRRIVDELRPLLAVVEASGRVSSGP